MPAPAGHSTPKINIKNINTITDPGSKFNCMPKTHVQNVSLFDGWAAAWDGFLNQHCLIVSIIDVDVHSTHSHLHGQLQPPTRQLVILRWNRGGHSLAIG